MTEREFKSILLPCYRRMYAMAFAILRNADDASDVVQDTVAHLWQRRPQMEVPDNPEAFCCTAVRNACLDRLKSAANRYFEGAEALLEARATEGSDHRAQYDSTREYIRRVLEGFPDRQRRVLTLSFLSQLSHDEISAVTGESPANVRQIISRGRTKLKEYLTNESKY